MKSLILFAAFTISLSVNAQTKDSLINNRQLQEVVVASVRVKKNAPYAVSNIKQKELNSFAKTGRELPFLFAQTPGIFAWSDNGLGTGSVAMRIRGAAGSRINITLDGMPLNSPEDQTVFWANMNSYGSLLNSVQIQRGIGTSTNGDGAFGGSISLATLPPKTTPYAELSSSYGSYNTYNTGINFSTGLFGKHFIFDGAYHETATDGFIHGTRGRSGSYYGGLTYIGDYFQIRYKNIGNFEKTGQAWNAVVAGNSNASLMGKDIKTYEDMYKYGLGRFNNLYEYLVFDKSTKSFVRDAQGNYITKRYKLDNGNLWERTTDNFFQNHNLLTIAWQPNKNWKHNITMRYTYGYGYYNEFRFNYKFKKFGLIATDANGKNIKEGDFVRRKGLEQNTTGLLYTANYKGEKIDLISGANLQLFTCDHFGSLPYVANKGQVQDFIGYKYYDSKGIKNDYSAYIKATCHANNYLDLFADLQYRHVFFSATGKNDKFVKQANGTFANQMLDIYKHYNFFNPKVGISYNRNGHKAYISAAYAGREPERNNFTNNYKYPAPKAEHLLDIEIGYQYEAKKWRTSANFYLMNYKNQLVQTGETSEIGEFLTTNIKKSYRMGTELSAGIDATTWLTLEGNASLSINKIKDFVEYVDNWCGKAIKINYNNSTLAYSPSCLLNGFINLHYKGIQAIWHTNYVSRQYLDNTENQDRSLPAFSQSNININYTLNFEKSKLGVKEMILGLNLNNIFNAHYAASGWVYSAVSAKDNYTNDKRYYQIGFIPMAGFNLMGNITLRF